MASTIEEKLDLIKECFDPEVFDRLEISGSFRVTLNAGQYAYIYPETFDNSITVRIEIAETNPDKQASDIHAIRETLSGILPFVSIGSFVHTQTIRTIRAYTARLDIDEPKGEDSNVSSPAGAEPGEGHEAHLSENFSVLDDNPEIYSAANLVTIDELQELLGMLDPYAMAQSLDWMYIDKSSKVRKALNRIFKSKVDRAELVCAIQEEARKFSEIEDLEEIEMLKHINKDIVLQPVINMLSHVVLKTNFKFNDS